jgi:hypothetical protein
MVLSFKLMSTENWPTASQRLLLKAALGEGESALCAWEEWQAANDINNLDHASFFVLPQLFLNLRRLGVDHPGLETLRGIYRYTWCKNQKATRSFIEVLRLFEDCKITSVLLKGAPLVLFHYEDLGGRLMNDIDLLIREVDLPAAAALLRDSQWRLTKPLPPRDFVPFVHAASYTHPRWMELDLHWRAFTVDCPPDVEARLWDRVLHREVQGLTVRMPDATDLLLLTCYHGRKGDVHTACRWVIDAAMLLKGTDSIIDWNALMERAEQTRLLVPLRDALTYLRQEFDAAVPDDVLQRAWGVPATPQDRTRYEKLLAGFRLRGLSLWGLLGFHWTRYASVRRARGQHAGLLGFARYLLAFHQWDFRVERRWQVPFVMVAKLLARLRRRGSVGK